MFSTLKNKRNFEFLWNIKNYSFCVQKENEYLRSSTFIAESLNNTQWYLDLYPKGSPYSDEGYIACYLQRALDDYPANIMLDFRLEIIGANDESVLVVYNSRPLEFKKGDIWGWNNFKKADFFVENRHMLLSDDTLKIQCVMEEIDSEKPPATFCRAESEISVDCFNFKWLIENFNSSDCDCKTSFFSGRTQIEVALHVEEDDINITISNHCGNNPTPLLVICKVTLLNVHGFETDSEQSEHLFEMEENWTFPQFLKKNGTMTFNVEGNKQNFIDGENFPQNTTAFYSLSEDLFRMYISRNSADMVFKCDDETYPCNRSLLAARSEVFLAMFTHNMVENNSRTVDIEDLDGETLDSMLRFCYTGTLKEKNFELISKLLIAADKYGIPSLKQECVAFLRSILSEGTVCEVLSLADMIDHFDLKSSAMDYIRRHWKKIVRSNEWNQLIENNFKVATEAFFNLSSDGENM